MSFLEQRAPLQGAVEVAGTNLLAPGERAGDNDRDRVVHFLGKMHSDGFIDSDTFHTRMNLASEADSRTKLRQLTMDLPPIPEPVSRRIVPKLQDRDTATRLKFLSSAIVGLGLAAGGPTVVYQMTGQHVFYSGGMGWVYIHGGVSVAAMFLLGTLGALMCVGALVGWGLWENKQ